MPAEVLGFLIFLCIITVMFFKVPWLLVVFAIVSSLPKRSKYSKLSLALFLRWWWNKEQKR